jgi:hypothetical protein
LTKVDYRLFELKGLFYYTAAGLVCCLRQYNFVTGLQTHRLPRELRNEFI